MMVAANAVRKAVNSSALTRPMGRPERSSIVSVPLGVVPDELATEAGGWKDAPLMLELELLVVEGERVTPLIAEVSDALDSLLSSGGSVASRATIFMPRDSPVLAGINSVVIPFLWITVR
jgi:hypothetical protein